MSQKTLPSIADFADQRITSGLQFVMGGANYEKTPGGDVSDGFGGKLDYIADAKYNGRQINGLCSGFKTELDFYVSDVFKAWCQMVGAEY